MGLTADVDLVENGKLSCTYGDSKPRPSIRGLVSSNKQAVRVLIPPQLCIEGLHFFGT